MSKTISVTLQDELFARLEEFRKACGHIERSGVVQRALAHFLGSGGPDPKVIRRWKAHYDRINDLELERSESWGKIQSDALGQP